MASVHWELGLCWVGRHTGLMLDMRCLFGQSWPLYFTPPHTLTHTPSSGTQNPPTLPKWYIPHFLYTIGFTCLLCNPSLLPQLSLEDRNCQRAGVLVPLFTIVSNPSALTSVLHTVGSQWMLSEWTEEWLLLHYRYHRLPPLHTYAHTFSCTPAGLV